MAGVTLQLNTKRWREHMDVVANETPGLVPVIKGNGYRFGLTRLADEASRLGVDTIAVGTPIEVATVADNFAGNIVILQPWRPEQSITEELVTDERVIFTVSSLSDLSKIAADPRRPRVLIEVLTSMRRHGIPVEDLAATPYLGDLRFEGWTMHLPLTTTGPDAEAERIARAALDVSPGTLWMSHLSPEEATMLSRRLGDRKIRSRVGTRLWLGDNSSRSNVATVLDVHPVRRGERIGYRQRPVPANGWVLIMAGGAAHGIGMEAPSAAASIRQRAISLANGVLGAAGLALSPYTVAGKKRMFCEPPHMQSSMIFLPGGEQPPSIGDEVPVELRMTTAAVDQIVETGSSERSC